MLLALVTCAGYVARINPIAPGKLLAPIRLQKKIMSLSALGPVVICKV